MIDTFDDFVSALKTHLTPEERASAVAYIPETQTPFAGGAQFQFPGIVLDIQVTSYLGFIDQEPTANWGHQARYLLIECDTGQVRSFQTRFPPFQSKPNLHWRVIYQAPSVPDANLQIPS